MQSWASFTTADKGQKGRCKFGYFIDTFHQTGDRILCLCCGFFDEFHALDCLFCLSSVFCHLKGGIFCNLEQLIILFGNDIDGIVNVCRITVLTVAN